MQDRKRDAFFTNEKVAEECLIDAKKIIPNFTDFNFLEPSAGSGNFTTALNKLGIKKNKILAYDIFPKSEEIIKADFLQTKIDSQIKTFSSQKKLITVGNPPFGKRSKLAISFFNKASKFSDIICFIVPNQFLKWSVQSKLSSDFNLIFQKKLKEDSFLLGEKIYKIKCQFQIWSRALFSQKNLRILSPPKISHKDFEMFQYNNTPQARKYFDKKTYKWDFAVARQGYYDYTKKIYEEKELNPKIQWIFFKAKSKEILAKLEQIDFQKLAENNTMILGFGKHDVVSFYMELYGE
ncbi:MAG: SAM-dependent methyltransferase [Alphaproteobacteria bacterium]|nr:MAG: hypothetical protein B6I23_00885 [Rickettsiaceae bacterium 4572_127]